VAKVTITIEDVDEAASSVCTSISSSPLPTEDFITQAHILGDMLYRSIPDYMTILKKGKDHG